MWQASLFWQLNCFKWRWNASSSSGPDSIYRTVMRWDIWRWQTWHAQTHLQWFGLLKCQSFQSWRLRTILIPASGKSTWYQKELFCKVATRLSTIPRWQVDERLLRHASWAPRQWATHSPSSNTWNILKHDSHDSHVILHLPIPRQKESTKKGCEYKLKWLNCLRFGNSIIPSTNQTANSSFKHWSELVMKIYEVFVKRSFVWNFNWIHNDTYHVESIVAIAACFLRLTAVLPADRWGVLLPYHGMSGFTFGKWCRFRLLRTQSRQAFNVIYNTLHKKKRI